MISNMSKAELIVTINQEVSKFLGFNTELKVSSYSKAKLAEVCRRVLILRNLDWATKNVQDALARARFYVAKHAAWDCVQASDADWRAKVELKFAEEIKAATALYVGSFLDVAQFKFVN